MWYLKPNFYPFTSIKKRGKRKSKNQPKNYMKGFFLFPPHPVHQKRKRNLPGRVQESGVAVWRWLGADVTEGPPPLPRVLGDGQQWLQTPGPSSGTLRSGQGRQCQPLLQDMLEISSAPIPSKCRGGPSKGSRGEGDRATEMNKVH